jgi:hypothetical protein
MGLGLIFNSLFYQYFAPMGLGKPRSFWATNFSSRMGLDTGCPMDATNISPRWGLENHDHFGLPIFRPDGAWFNI